MIPITDEQLHALAPNMHPVYRRALECRDAILHRYEINATPLRLSHFLAQVTHECGRFTVLTESINYAVNALEAKFVRVKKPRMTSEQAMRLGRLGARKAQQVSIANIIYGGAFGREQLGNTEPGDGWTFRGHGIPQLTGRDNFTRMSRRLSAELGGKVDLVANPALTLDPAYALYIACIFWTDGDCNAIADSDTFAGADERDNPVLRTITKGWNGGYNGLEDRARLLQETKAIYL